MAVEVSHGRGGAGNINEDPTQYVDGEVVRSGVIGSHGDGAFSSGRGGAGNIGDVGRAPTPRNDQDVVPNEAYRASQDKQDYHTGRGGAGNEHVAEPQAKTSAQKQGERTPVGLADKLKNKIFSAIKK